MSEIGGSEISSRDETGDEGVDRGAGQSRQERPLTRAGMRAVQGFVPESRDRGKEPRDPDGEDREKAEEVIRRMNRPGGVREGESPDEAAHRHLEEIDRESEQSKRESK
jgi:hypothetical protein